MCGDGSDSQVGGGYMKDKPTIEESKKKSWPLSWPEINSLQNHGADMIKP